MYIQPATILLYCCLSQQKFSGNFCILAIPTPHSPSLLHPLQPGFPPHHPHRNSSDQDQQLPLFFQSPLTTLTLILFIFSALFGMAVHVLLESHSALDYTLTFSWFSICNTRHSSDLCWFCLLYKSLNVALSSGLDSQSNLSP